ncbi:MAG: 3-hydroxyacyl-CoA dehydrogenase NAD-binding domain-containing protein [Ferruginibacter sp.]|nr:3-hydroxybutyryl-CoA dehydrogenase [Ferruginibacter sp.]
MIKNICVAGAGTMGSGIALCAAQNNFVVVLFDTNQNGIENAKNTITKNLNFLLAKEKISVEEKEIIYNRILFTTNINDCVGDVVIEAIVENIEIKETLYKTIASINNANTILASNTSSLSISAIQKNIEHPQRVCGMHFFNPAHIMKLVEVVAGEQTSENTIKSIFNLCLQLKKQPVICKDAPGFIVNRVARHYYLEAMHIASTQNIAIENIDALLENVGFKMGPFKLMDLIGLDVNYAVSKSIYAAFDNNLRFAPAALQAQKVTEGKLGKKSGEGFYKY